MQKLVWSRKLFISASCCDYLVKIHEQMVSLNIFWNILKYFHFGWFRQNVKGANIILIRGFQRCSGRATWFEVQSYSVTDQPKKYIRRSSVSSQWLFSTALIKLTQSSANTGTRHALTCLYYNCLSSQIMNEFILNYRSPWFITVEHIYFGSGSKRTIPRKWTKHSGRVNGHFTLELTNHNSLFRPGSKSLRFVATRSLTFCQKRVFSVKYPTTKIIIK